MPTTSPIPFSWGHVRPLTTLTDCKHFQNVQQRIWVGAEDDLVPTHMLITLAKNGGMVLGAFATDGPPETDGMVGICLGWTGFGRRNGGPEEIKFCSHIVGVLPSWHGRGIGLTIKLAQRQILQAEGRTDWVTWTYDPIQRVNGSLNIHRLGATCNTYLCNVYGEMPDKLNAGMPTDRFQVDWQIDSERVETALREKGVPSDWSTCEIERLETRPIAGTDLAGTELRLPVEQEPRLDGRPLAVPLPDSVSALRQADTAYLLEWRLALRRAMEAAFAKGYQVADCVQLGKEGWHYVLRGDGAMGQ